VAPRLPVPAPAEGRETLAFATYQRWPPNIFNNTSGGSRPCSRLAPSAASTIPLFAAFSGSMTTKSPYQYLLRLKITLPAELLLHPPLVSRWRKKPASETRSIVFRAFKTVFGLSPDAFRPVAIDATDVCENCSTLSLFLTPQKQLPTQ